MGIRNIQFFINPDDDHSRRLSLQAKAALEEKLIADHRQGKHPWGSMRRECPYCQADK